MALFKNHPELAQHLEQHGYVVVRAAATPEQADSIREDLWTFLETATGGAVKKEQPQTWDKWLYNTHGLVQFFNVGWSKPAIDARIACKNVFRDLYGTDKLVSSFDGVAFNPPPKTFKFDSVQDWQNRKFDVFGGSGPKAGQLRYSWLHIDKTKKNTDTAFQGGLCLDDQDEADNVFEVMPGSHKYFNEILDMTGGECPRNFRKLDTRAISFLREKGLDSIRVPLRKGDIVLWDSRSVHASAPAVRSGQTKVRSVAFVCMMPSDKCNPKDIEKRNKAVTEGRTSAHWPNKVTLFGKRPWAHGKTVPIAETEKPEALAERKAQVLSLPNETLSLLGLVPYAADTVATHVAKRTRLR